MVPLTCRQTPQRKGETQVQMMFKLSLAELACPDFVEIDQLAWTFACEQGDQLGGSRQLKAELGG